MRSLSKSSARSGEIGAGPFFAAAAFAVAAAIVVPFLFGAFANDEVPLVLALEFACLAIAGACGLVIARRVEASRASLWSLARRDELTGVGNYRALTECLADQVARHAKSGGGFGLILVDLDGFKDVNEALGHLEGDRVLIEVGAALLTATRDQDLVFRQGGDEFAVLLGEADRAALADVARRIDERLRDCSRETAPVSAGLGSALFPDDGSNPDRLFHRADIDLLDAKRSRRAGGR